MRILHLVNVRWYNATAWYGVNLARIQQDAGHEVVVAGLPGSPPLREALKYGLRVHAGNFNTNNPVRLLRTAGRLRAFVEQFAPDVVFCHRGEFFWYFALGNCMKDAPYRLVRVRGDVRPIRGSSGNRWLHNSCTDLIITSGSFIAESFSRMLDTPREKVHTVYGGVDTTVFKPDPDGRIRVRREFGFADEDYVIGVVGRFDPVKGHEYLIRAVSELYVERGMREVRLVIAGWPSNISEKKMTLMLEDAGIAGITVMTGKRDDISAVMSSFDIGVVSSIGSEAICRVAMEIAACGVPVASFDAGVLPEIVPPSMVVPSRDSHALADLLGKKPAVRMPVYSDEDFYRSVADAVASIPEKTES